MDFDPLGDPAALSDIEAQQQALLRQIKLAELLRKQSLDSQATSMPEGQMVSGHYIAPHWTQQLAGVINPIMAQRRAAQAEEQAQQKQSVLSQALQAAKQGWMDQMPQGTPGQEPVAPVQGAPIERGGMTNPEATGTPGVAPQLPSVLEQMRWVGRGAQIPGNAPLAMALGKTLEGERTREDAQQEKQFALKQSLEAQKQLKLEQLAAEERRLRERLDDKTLDRASTERIAGQHNAVMTAIAAMRTTGTKELTPAQQEVKTRDLQRQIEHMERSVEPVARLAMSAQEVQNIVDNATDPKTGKVASIPGFGFTSKLGMSMGVAEKAGFIPKGSTVNNQAVQEVLTSVLRSNAGLSQTLTEQANTLKTMLAGGNFSQDQFTEGWKRFTKLLNSELENKTKVATPEAVEIYMKRGGRTSGVKSKFEADQGPATLGTPQGISQVANDDEYNRLPKGAKYMGPDGIVRVK